MGSDDYVRKLEEGKAYAENMLSFERNKFQRLMETREAGIAEELSDRLKLELQAIGEIAEYLGDDDKRRIQRRLQRIDKILSAFGK